LRNETQIQTHPDAVKMGSSYGGVFCLILRVDGDRRWLVWIRYQAVARSVMAMDDVVVLVDVGDVLLSCNKQKMRSFFPRFCDLESAEITKSQI
jgi:hypothetical protein